MEISDVLIVEVRNYFIPATHGWCKRLFIVRVEEIGSLSQHHAITNPTQPGGKSKK